MNRVFDTFDVGEFHIVCAHELADELKRIYRDGSPVYDRLAGMPGTSVLRGRIPVMCGAVGDRVCVVKRLSHGGIFAVVTGDRFLTPKRLLAGMKSAEYLESNGILTPRYLFAAWRRIGMWIRCESGIDYLEGGRDAASLLFDETLCRTDETGCIRHAESIGATVRRLHACRFIHPDLNLMNFLVLNDGRIAVLDLDKASPPGGDPGPGRCRRNLARLIRSIRKIGAPADAGHRTETIVASVRRGYGIE